MIETNDKVDTQRCLLAVINLSQAEVDNGVIVMWLIPNTPSQIHHLKPIEKSDL